MTNGETTVKDEDGELVDDFGRTLGEQVRDQILYEHVFDHDQHLNEEYRSDTTHQDGDLPYRMQVTYRDGGPSYYINDYFPHHHYQTAANLAEQNYKLLIVHWGTRENRSLEDLLTDSGDVGE